MRGAAFLVWIRRAGLKTVFNSQVTGGFALKDSASTPQPAPSARSIDKRPRPIGDLLFIGAGIRCLKLRDNVRNAALSVATLQDLTRAHIELDKPFRIKDDVGILTGFPAENEMRCEARAGLEGDGEFGGHGWMRRWRRAVVRTATAVRPPGVGLPDVDVSGNLEAEADVTKSRIFPGHVESPFIELCDGILSSRD